MDYWVIVSQSPHFTETATNDLFATPFQAHCSMEGLYRPPGYNYFVRPATWQEREARMFIAGVYEQPVWHDEPFWQNNRAYFIEHFVHVSTADPSTIAFTEDERKGEADRQTLIKPGKYLQKFLGAGTTGMIEHGPLKGMEPRITKQQVAYYAAWHHAGRRPASDDSLLFADTAEEMIRVYRTGPYSCMRGCDKDWSDDEHPVQVYAAGDLQFAYLVNGAGDVLGRALCWPEKKVFGRVYPTPNSERDQNLYNELHDRLKGLGWTSINERQDVFEGARLLRVTNDNGVYMMPYLDHEYGVEYSSTSHWRMSTDSHHQDNTDGTYCHGDDCDSEPDWTCDSCDDGYSDDDDSRSVYSGWRSTGIGGGGYPTGERQWCRSCTDNDAFYCDGTDEYYLGNVDRVDTAGSVYNRAWFMANGGYQCSWDDEYYFRDDDPPVTLTNGALVHPDNLEEAAFQCFFDGRWWPIDFESLAVPGYSQPCDVLDVHPVEMEFTLPDFLVHSEDVQAWAVSYHAVPPLQFPETLALAA